MITINCAEILVEKVFGQILQKHSAELGTYHGCDLWKHLLYIFDIDLMLIQLDDYLFKK
jgi:hypothetical protein